MPPIAKQPTPPVGGSRPGGAGLAGAATSKAAGAPTAPGAKPPAIGTSKADAYSGKAEPTGPVPTAPNGKESAKATDGNTTNITINMNGDKATNKDGGPTTEKEGEAKKEGCAGHDKSGDAAGKDAAAKDGVTGKEEKNAYGSKDGAQSKTGGGSGDDATGADKFAQDIKGTVKDTLAKVLDELKNHLQGGGKPPEGGAKEGSPSGGSDAPPLDINELFNKIMGQQGPKPTNTGVTPPPGGSPAPVTGPYGSSNAAKTPVNNNNSRYTPVNAGNAGDSRFSEIGSSTDKSSGGNNLTINVTPQQTGQYTPI
jgi:hypothetical protein